nr:MAG TPA: hypothetical protein [Caudoviricetes sp.]
MTIDIDHFFTDQFQQGICCPDQFSRLYDTVRNRLITKYHIDRLTILRLVDTRHHTCCNGFQLVRSLYSHGSLIHAVL